MKKRKIIYVCERCQAEISHGAIICHYCKRRDPKVKAIGVSND